MSFPGSQLARAEAAEAACSVHAEGHEAGEGAAEHADAPLLPHLAAGADPAALNGLVAAASLAEQLGLPGGR